MTAAAVLSWRFEPPPFDIVRAAHAELEVSDLDAAAGFYVDVLGLVVTERTADAAPARRGLRARAAARTRAEARASWVRDPNTAGL